MDLLTTFDLQNILTKARLEGKWGQSILTADVFHDGLTVAVPQGKTKEAREALRAILDHAFMPTQNGQEDDMVRLNNDLKLPVYWDEDDEDAKPRPFDLRPLLRDTVLLTENIQKSAINQAILHDTTELPSPRLTAFFSFKGGVGRTLHLTAFAHLLAKTLKSDFSSPKILLVDADIEAPGITWWTRDALPASPYSFLDLLGDAHQDVEDAATKAAQNIRSLRLQFGNASHACYFLPLFRDEMQLLRPPVLPERLVLSAENHWIIGELFIALGKRLKVDHILVDLRAGLTELSSPLFLDPRVNRVLVSTTSSQSVEGTILVLRQLANFAKLFFPENAYADNTQVLLGFIPSEGDPNIPATIISRFEEILQQLVPESPESSSLDLASWVIESEYDQNLLGLGGFSESLVTLSKSQTIQKASALLMSKITSQSTKAGVNNSADEASNQKTDISHLTQYLKDLIYAENQQETDYLVTDAYRRLASSFLQQIPNAVILGAKGSGKTFFSNMFSAIGQWGKFCKSCQLSGARDAWLIPVYWSKNIETNTRTLLLQWQTERVQRFNASWSKEKGEKLEKELQESFGTPHEPKKHTEWRELWFAYFCSLLGVHSSEGSPWEQVFKKAAPLLQEQVVFLFDGFEDLFDNWLRRKDEEGITPLRILLQEIIRDMPSFSDSKVGILLFIRKDIVQRAIGQNFGQFISRYSNYELRWSKEEALRLVGWVLKKCGLQRHIKSDTEKEWEAADFARMAEALNLFWGMKLGKDESKEAFTVNWVFSVISDFKGNIQARDILRLLLESAKAQSNKPFYTDRLLSPPALRGALQQCGEQKIEEIKQEVTMLVADLNKLKERSPSVPLTQQIIQSLKLENVAIFEEFGLLFQDGADYYLPEIYRQGLNLPLEGRARPKVVLLMRKALAKAGIPT